MGLEENKAVVRDYLDRMARNDESMADLLADDIVWWVPPSTDYGGTYRGKQAVLELYGGARSLYSDAAMQVEIEEMTAEEDRVAVAFVLRAKTAKGEDYENYYHFGIRVRAGQLVHVREFLDSKYAFDKLMS